MNRVNRGEMSEWMEMTWNNPMGMVLWSVESVEVNRVNRDKMSDLKDLMRSTLWESPYGR